MHPCTFFSHPHNPSSGSLHKFSLGKRLVQGHTAHTWQSSRSRPPTLTLIHPSTVHSCQRAGPGCEHPTSLRKVLLISPRHPARPRRRAKASERCHVARAPGGLRKNLPTRTGSSPPGLGLPHPGLLTNAWTWCSWDTSRVVPGWVPRGTSVYNWQPWKDPSPWAGLRQASSRPTGPVFLTRVVLS